MSSKSIRRLSIFSIHSHKAEASDLNTNNYSSAGNINLNDRDDAPSESDKCYGNDHYERDPESTSSILVTNLNTRRNIDDVDDEYAFIDTPRPTNSNTGTNTNSGTLTSSSTQASNSNSPFKRRVTLAFTNVFKSSSGTGNTGNMSPYISMVQNKPKSKHFPNNSTVATLASTSAPVQPFNTTPNPNGNTKSILLSKDSIEFTIEKNNKKGKDLSSVLSYPNSYRAGAGIENIANSGVYSSTTTTTVQKPVRRLSLISSLRKKTSKKNLTSNSSSTNTSSNSNSNSNPSNYKPPPISTRSPRSSISASAPSTPIRISPPQIESFVHVSSGAGVASGVGANARNDVRLLRLDPPPLPDIVSGLFRDGGVKWSGGGGGGLDVGDGKGVEQPPKMVEISKDTITDANANASPGSVELLNELELEQSQVRPQKSKAKSDFESKRKTKLEMKKKPRSLRLSGSSALTTSTSDSLSTSRTSTSISVSNMSFGTEQDTETDDTSIEESLLDDGKEMRVGIERDVNGSGGGEEDTDNINANGNSNLRSPIVAASTNININTHTTRPIRSSSPAPSMLSFRSMSRLNVPIHSSTTSSPAISSKSLSISSSASDTGDGGFYSFSSSSSSSSARSSTSSSALYTPPRTRRLPRSAPLPSLPLPPIPSLNSLTSISTPPLSFSSSLSSQSSSLSQLHSLRTGTLTPPPPRPVRAARRLERDGTVGDGTVGDGNVSGSGMMTMAQVRRLPMIPALQAGGDVSGNINSVEDASSCGDIHMRAHPYATTPALSSTPISSSIGTIKGPRPLPHPHHQPSKKVKSDIMLSRFILSRVASFLSLHDLASLARVDKGCLGVARAGMYSVISNSNWGAEGGMDEGPNASASASANAYKMVDCLKSLLTSSKISRPEESLGRFVKVFNWVEIDIPPSASSSPNSFPSPDLSSSSSSSASFSTLPLLFRVLPSLSNIHTLSLHLPTSKYTSSLLPLLTCQESLKILELKGFTSFEGGVGVVMFLRGESMNMSSSARKNQNSKNYQIGGVRGKIVNLESLSLPDMFYLPFPHASSYNQQKQQINFLSSVKILEAPLSLLLTLPTSSLSSQSPDLALSNSPTPLPSIQSLSTQLTTSLSDGTHLFPSSIIAFLSSLPLCLRSLEIKTTKRVDMNTFRMFLQEVGRILGGRLRVVKVVWGGANEAGAGPVGDDVIKQITPILATFQKLHTLVMTFPSSLSSTSSSTIPSFSTSSSVAHPNTLSPQTLKLFDLRMFHISTVCRTLRRVEVWPAGRVWTF